MRAILVRGSARVRITTLAILLIGLLGPLGPEGAGAHTFERTRTSFRVDRSGGFVVALTLDLDALALGIDPRTDPGEAARPLDEMTEAERARAADGLLQLLARRLRVRADGKPVAFEVWLPPYEPLASRRRIEAFGLEARLAGRLPEGTREVRFFASRAFPAIELRFRDERTGREEFHICLPGDECPAIGLSPGAPASGLAEFVVIGFRHIVPLGLDHILFVLALFLGGREMKTLLIQTGLFTLAHSLTLALATFGVLSLSPRIVEPLIALSIGIVGLENVARPSGVSRSRAIVVVIFGLLHGLGFAGVLAETPLAEGPRLAALLLFNLGVELGQILVLVAALVLSVPFKDPIVYRRYVERPLSMALGIAGMVWAALRVAS